jgi:hypothetical protein
MNMSRKMKLVAASLSALLAIAVLAAVASAGEFTAHCERGEGQTCTGSISGTNLELVTTEGQAAVCSSIKGTASLTGGSTTMTLELDFGGCRETVTAFQYFCGTPQQTQTFQVGPVAAHIVNLAEAPATTPGLLITNVDAGWFCGPGGAPFGTMTGNLIGLLENPQCNTYATTQNLQFQKASNGHQTFTQVTETGTIFDLSLPVWFSGYKTASTTSTTSISWNAGNRVKITC